MARIKVNGKISDAFPLSRGTRQGCPLPSLLYALVVEPLAIAIRAHPDIRGLRLGSLVETVSLYADDMLYLEDAGPSLLAALNLIERFGKFSVLQITWDKSQILPLVLGPQNVDQAQLSLIRASQTKYLGNQVTRS